MTFRDDSRSLDGLLMSPSRRSVVRVGAWAVPAVTVMAAAPAYACVSGQTSSTKSTVLNWDAPGVSFTRASNVSASAEWSTANGVIFTVGASAAYTGNMKSGAEFANNGNANFTRQAQVGGLTTGGLQMEQATTRKNPSTADTGTYTFTFSQPVTDLTFTITDIDSNSDDFRDSLTLTPGFTEVSKATAVEGSGTVSLPYKSNTTNGGLNNTTSGLGNVKVKYAGPISAFSITYSNISSKFNEDTDTNQAIYITDLDFKYEFCQ